MALKDSDIREPLFDFLETTYGKVRILEEKTIGRSRADVMMITEDSICGLEIKSDADSYARLETQVKDYDKYYDFNYVVVGTKHAMHIEEHVPSYWGIITVEEADSGVDCYILRKPESNPKVKLEKKLQILWRMELAKIQELNDMPKYKDKSKAFVIKAIIARTKYEENKKGYINLSVVNKQISEILLERDYTLVKEQLKEYYKSEIQKKIEKEEDPIKKAELIKELEKKTNRVNNRTFKKKRRRRRF